MGYTYTQILVCIQRILLRGGGELCPIFLMRTRKGGGYTGVMLNFFTGWPIGPAKIWFGWPAVNFTGPRYFRRARYNHNNVS